MRKGTTIWDKFVGFYSDTSPNVPSPTAHAFLYDNGQWSNLDDPAAVNGTFAEDINDSGVLVGYYVDANRLAHGFVFDRSTGTWTTIDYPGASQTFINGINDFRRDRRYVRRQFQFLIRSRRRRRSYQKLPTQASTRSITSLTTPMSPRPGSILISII